MRGFEVYKGRMVQGVSEFRRIKEVGCVMCMGHTVCGKKEAMLTCVRRVNGTCDMGCAGAYDIFYISARNQRQLLRQKKKVGMKTNKKLMSSTFKRAAAVRELVNYPASCN